MVLEEAAYSELVAPVVVVDAVAYPPLSYSQTRTRYGFHACGI